MAARKKEKGEPGKAGKSGAGKADKTTRGKRKATPSAPPEPDGRVLAPAGRAPGPGPREEEILRPPEEETAPPEPVEVGPDPSDLPVARPEKAEKGPEKPKKRPRPARGKGGRVVSRGYDLGNPEDLFALVSECEDEKALKEAVAGHVESLVAGSGLGARYLVLILHEETRLIRRAHANLLLAPARAAAGEKDILLVLHSSGGQIEAAYLISRMLKRLAKSRFACAAPRRAKSAATLVCLGADEIHLGLLSELGPIDPQIGGYPVTWLTNAMDVLAKIAAQFPGSADMLGKFLAQSLNLKSLGYFGRVNDSAATYAERLLSGKGFPRPHTAKSLADHFVNHYTDHGFVIDSEEAAALLGPMVKTGTPEIALAETVYGFLEQLDQALEASREKAVSWVGDVASGLTLRDRPG